jgi:hypothetical protein
MEPSIPVGGHPALKQALAIAIVQSKRKRTQDLELLEAKAKHLEAELMVQQTEYKALQSWAKSLLQPPQDGLDDQEAPKRMQGGLPAFNHDSSSFWSHPSNGGPLEVGFSDLQHQASILTDPGVWARSDTLRLALNSKARSLCSMLLGNIQMMQKVHRKENLDHSSPDNLMQPSPLDTATLMNTFVLDTLIEVPAR